MRPIVYFLLWYLLLIMPLIEASLFTLNNNFLDALNNKKSLRKNLNISVPITTTIVTHTPLETSIYSYSTKLESITISSEQSKNEASLEQYPTDISTQQFGSEMPDNQEISDTYESSTRKSVSRTSTQEYSNAYFSLTNILSTTKNPSTDVGTAISPYSSWTQSSLPNTEASSISDPSRNPSDVLEISSFVPSSSTHIPNVYNDPNRANSIVSGQQFDSSSSTITEDDLYIPSATTTMLHSDTIAASIRSSEMGDTMTEPPELSSDDNSNSNVALGKLTTTQMAKLPTSEEITQTTGRSSSFHSTITEDASLSFSITTASFTTPSIDFTNPISTVSATSMPISTISTPLITNIISPPITPSSPSSIPSSYSPSLSPLASYPSLSSSLYYVTSSLSESILVSTGTTSVTIIPDRNTPTNTTPSNEIENQSKSSNIIASTLATSASAIEDSSVFSSTSSLAPSTKHTTLLFNSSIYVSTTSTYATSSSPIETAPELTSAQPETSISFISDSSNRQSSTRPTSVNLSMNTTPSSSLPGNQIPSTGSTGNENAPSTTSPNIISSVARTSQLSNVTPTSLQNLGSFLTTNSISSISVTYSAVVSSFTPDTFSSSEVGSVVSQTNVFPASPNQLPPTTSTTLSSTLYQYDIVSSSILSTTPITSSIVISFSGNIDSKLKTTNTNPSEPISRSLQTIQNNIQSTLASSSSFGTVGTEENAKTQSTITLKETLRNSQPTAVKSRLNSEEYNNDNDIYSSHNAEIITSTHRISESNESTNSSISLSDVAVTSISKSSNSMSTNQKGFSSSISINHNTQTVPPGSEYNVSDSISSVYVYSSVSINEVSGVTSCPLKQSEPNSIARTTDPPNSEHKNSTIPSITTQNPSRSSSMKAPNTTNDHILTGNEISNSRKGKLGHTSVKYSHTTTYQPTLSSQAVGKISDSIITKGSNIPTSLLDGDNQEVATNEEIPLRHTTSNRNIWLPTSIIHASSLDQTATADLAAIATMPAAITPSEEPTGSADCTLITIGFRNALAYPFLIETPLSAAQVFNFLPHVLYYPFASNVTTISKDADIHVSNGITTISSRLAKRENIISAPEFPNSIGISYQNTIVNSFVDTVPLQMSSIESQESVSYTVSATYEPALENSLNRAKFNLSDITVKRIIPYVIENRTYVTAVAEVFFPTEYLDDLKNQVNYPGSQLYYNPKPNYAMLARLIDPSIYLTGLSYQDVSTSNNNTTTENNIALTSESTLSYLNTQNNENSQHAGAIDFVAYSTNGIKRPIRRRMLVFITGLSVGAFLWIGVLMRLLYKIRDWKYQKSILTVTIEKLPHSGQTNPFHDNIGSLDSSFSDYVSEKYCTKSYSSSSVKTPSETNIYSANHDIRYFVGQNGDYYYYKDNIHSDETKKMESKAISENSHCQYDGWLEEEKEIQYTYDDFSRNDIDRFMNTSPFNDRKKDERQQ